MHDPRGGDGHRQGISHNQKREILWNIIQPGDPFDIKRSMIAKLPGDRKTFMGAHLQLVCFLQAAQIERLCEYLEEYKLRYREIERVELDRHSYEIQIKELTMQLADENSFKSENLKLRDFIKKLTVQLEQMRKKAGNQTDLQQKYQMALNQLDSLRGENSRIMHERRAMLTDIDHLNAQIKAMEAAKLRQFQEIKVQFSDSSKIAFDRERREIIMRFESQISRLQYDNKRLRDSNDTKNREIQQLQRKNRQMYAQIEEEHSKNQRFGGIQKTLKEYETRFGLVGQEIQRLNLVLREKTDELNQLYGRYQHIEVQIQRRDSHINELQNRLRQNEIEVNQYQVSIKEYKSQMDQYNSSKRIIEDYENRMSTLSRQVQRLNDVLKRKVNENQQMIKRIKELQYEFSKVDLIGRENEELRRGVQEINDLRRRLAEYESKMARLTQEIERLNSVLRSKVENQSSLDNQNRSLIRQLQIARSRISEIEQSMNYSIQTKMTTYEQRIQSFTQENQELRAQLKAALDRTRQISQYQSRLQQLSQQIQRLNANLRMKVDQLNKMELNNRNLQQECENYRRRINEVEINLGGQLKSKITVYQQKSIEMNRRLAEYENKMALLSQEIQRLNIALRSKVDQMGSLEQRNRYLQQEWEGAQRKIVEMSQEISEGWRVKTSTYQQKITQFQQENQQLRRRLKQLSQVNRKISEYENKIMQLSAEVDRLNSLLERYTKDNSTLNQRVGQNQQLRVSISSLQIKFEQLLNENKRTIQELRICQQSNRNCNGQLQQLTVKLTRVINQRDQLSRRLKDFGDSDVQIRRRAAEYENKMALLSQEIERLNQALRSKVDQVNAYDQRHRSLNQDIENAKRKFAENQTMLIQEWRSKITIFQQQNDELRRRTSEYETKIALLSQQIQRLNQNLRAKVDECSSFDLKLKSTIKELQTSKRRLIELETVTSQEWQSRMNAYEQRVQSYTQQNDQLKRKLSELIDGNRKLNEYENKMTMLSQEVQRLNQSLRAKVNENNNYQQKIRALQSDRDQCRRKLSEYQGSNNQVKNQISYYQRQVETYRVETEQLKRRLNEAENSNRRIPEYENKIGLMNQEIQRLNLVLRTKVDQNSSYEQRIRSMQQELQQARKRFGDTQLTIINQYKTKFTVFQQQITTYKQENQELKRRLKQLSDANRKLSQYETKIVLLSQQIDRLNLVLDRTSKETSSSLNTKLQESQQLRQKVNQLVEQNRRLTDQLRAAQQNHRNYGGQINDMTLRVTHLITENDQLKRRLNDFGDINRRVVQYQSRIVFLEQQNGKINQHLKMKSEQLNNSQQRIRILVQQLDVSKRKIVQTQSTIIHQFKSQLEVSDQENQGLRRRVNELSGLNRKVVEYESRIGQLIQQIQRLNNNMKYLVDEMGASEQNNRNLQHQLELARKKLGNTEITIINQWKSKVSIYQNQIAAYTQENQDLRRKIKQLSDSNRKIVEYENRIALMSQEIDRLNQALRGKVDEMSNYDSKYRSLQTQLENSRRKASQLENSVVHEWKSKVSIYQQKVTSSSQQNDELRRKINDLLVGNQRITEYENRLNMSSQEIERLNQALRGKLQQLSSSEQRIINLQKECDTLKRRLSQTESNIVNQWKSKVSYYQQQVSTFSQENQEMRRKLKDLSDQNRRIAEYQNRIALLGQEIERLNRMLGLKVDELKTMEQQNRTLRSDLDNARRKISELEGSFNNQYRSKITTYQQRISSYEQKITVYTQENQDLKRKIKELSAYESKCLELGREIQRLNGVFRSVQMDYENKILSYESRISTYEQKVGGYERETEEQRRRLHQLTELNRRLAEYQNKIALISQEIQRLNSSLKGKVEELNNSQHRVRSLQQELESIRRNAGDYQGRATKLVQEVERLNLLLKEINEKNYALGSELDLMRRKEPQYLSDIERLNNTLRLKVQEAQRLQTSYNELYVKYQEYENKSHYTASEFQKLQTAYNMVSSEYQNSKKHLNEYETSIQKLYAQFQRLQLIMQELKKENNMLKLQLQKSDGTHEKNRVLSAEIDRLNRIIEEQNQEISELRLRLSDEIALQKRINEHMALMVVLFAEIESLRKRVKDKEKEVEEVRRSSLAPFKV